MSALFHRLFLGVILIAAAALLLAGSWYCYTSTFDTGTVGLMSVNIAQGDRPLFYYGQPYFGALEAYLGAVFVSLLGFSEFAVSLSPISFTLAWIVFTYLLFSRVHNRTGGLVAAACAAFPGYYVFWYSIATYGGYSAVLCLGTAVLWLSLRVLQENPRKIFLLLHCLGIGILMGLGIWVHALIFPYIAISGGILGWYILRERFRPGAVLSLAAAAVIALSGFLPFYLETGSFLGGVSEPVHLTGPVIAGALYNLFVVNSHELIVWNFTHVIESPPARILARYSGLAVLAAAVPLAFISLLFTPRRHLKRANYLVPLLFCLLFLALYVQHHLATVKAPRYAMSLLVMLICMLWSLAVAGQTRHALKIVTAALFSIWIGYQVTGTVLFISGNAPNARHEQKTVGEVVDTARSRGLKSVVAYGDHVLGLKAQKFSMFAENSIVFVGAETERYQRNAQFAETDLQRGYLAAAENKTSLENTLKELGVTYRVDEVAGYVLFSGLDPGPRLSMRAIPGEDILPVAGQDDKTGAAARLLVDRSQDAVPALKNIQGRTVTFDTGTVRDLCAIWLFTFQDPASAEWKRPGPFEVLVSRDGIEFTRVFRSLPRSGNGFFAGPSPYVGGPWGKMEGIFAPVPGRYVRVVLPEDAPERITEVFLFETDGSLREESARDLERIVRIVEEENLKFVLADRWMSAKLLEAFKGTDKGDIALPRFSTRYHNRPLLYFVLPEKGQAVLCDAGVAEECERALVREYGGSSISSRLDLDSYSLFILADPEKEIDRRDGSALLWNGHFPLRTRDESLLPAWFNSFGLPIWRADFTRTKGVYRDSWTNGKGVFLDLDYTIVQGKDRELHIHTHGWRPGSEMSSLQLRAVANGKIPLEYKEKTGNTFIFGIPGSLTRLDSIALLSTTFVPPGPDARNLGLDVRYIEIR